MLRLLAALLGPIFAKEMVEVSRRRRYYANRLLYGAVLLITISCVWQAWAYSGVWWGRGGYSIQQAAALARTLFLTVAWVQYLSVYALVPVFLCGTIAAEREAHTLELLFTTRLRDREIVLGKVASRGAVTLLLIASGVPVLSLISLFGGIDPRAIWLTFAATLLALVFAGAHAIYFSAASGGPMAALLRTYWWLGVEIVALPMVVVMVMETFGLVSVATAQSVGTVIAFTNPVATFLPGIIPEFDREIRQIIGEWYLLGLYVWPLLLSGLLLWRGTARLRTKPTPRGLFGLFGLVAWWKEMSGSLRAWAARRRRVRAPRLWRTFPVRNPLWLRARQALPYDREGHVRRIQWGGVALVVIFIVLVLINDASDLADDEMAMIFLSCVWAGIALFVAVISASSLVGDLRRGFFEITLTTMLRPREFFFGTLAAVREHLKIIVRTAVGLSLMFTLTGAVGLWGAIGSFISAALFCALLSTQGVMCSLAARSVPEALIPTMALGLLMLFGLLPLLVFEEAAAPILFVGSLVLLPAVIAWARRSTSAAAIGTLLIVVHLAFMSVVGIVALLVEPRDEEMAIAVTNPGFWMIYLLDNHVDDEALVVLPLYWIALAINIVGARRWTLRHFDRLVGRTLPRPERELGTDLKSADVVAQDAGRETLVEIAAEPANLDR